MRKHRIKATLAQRNRETECVYISAQLRMARAMWGKLSPIAVESLRMLLGRFSLSLASGDILRLNGGWYVTHSGLLRVAAQNGCFGIRVQPLRDFCDAANDRWAFEATVFKGPGCRGFVGFGDANPTNVSPSFHGAEMRVAETRAVNRALRKAYGIGICSVEELGFWSAPPAANPNKLPPQPASGNRSPEPKLRERLCLLIRQHRLEGVLVKRYAAEFCGVADLRQASREQVERFVDHLAEAAQQDPAGLVAKLDRYRENEAGAA